MKLTVGKTSKTYQSIEECADVVQSGIVLAIDPSSGSANSVPGYCLFNRGKYVDSGVLNVDKSMPLHKKLAAIAECISSEFTHPDVLAIEYIQGHFQKSGYRREVYTNFKALSILHQSIGAIKAGADATHCVEIPPSAWKSKAPEGYLKSDENDAIMIGYTVIQNAFGEWCPELPPQVVKKLLEDKDG